MTLVHATPMTPNTVRTVAAPDIGGDTVTSYI